ncbi:MAG: glycosyltransferase family 2 protein [Oscillospiraceae bacterium]|nr:glycosyltransferase family 2 protein [Oscillospiraceae bacterium]
MSKISVVIPIYNVEEYVERCLASVTGQTLRDIEIILVNDGTKDGSMERCRRFMESDPRIVVVHKENGGLMSAWIEGVKRASAPYIGFVDSDDWVDPDFFEVLYENICRRQADMVVGRYVYESDEGDQVLPRSHDTVYAGEEEIRKLTGLYLNAFLLEDNPISYCRWDKLYRRELLINALPLLNTKISLGEDVNTNVAVLPDCRCVAVLHETPFYHYMHNKTSIVNTYKRGQIQNILELYRTLLHIADVKSVDREDIRVFIGNMIFEETNKLLRLQLGAGEKRQICAELLHTEESRICLRAYMRRRGVAHRAYYVLLRRGCMSFCTLLRKHIGAG